MTEQLQLTSVGGKRVDRGADISKCGQYRYTLWRCWDDDLPAAVFVMLNPSTADAWEDDATVRKCVGFARRWGCGAVVVVNLFAYRTTYPKVLVTKQAAGIDIVGPENDEVLATTLEKAQQRGWKVVVGWGRPVRKSIAEIIDVRAHALLTAARALERPAEYFGTMRDANPRHSFDSQLQCLGTAKDGSPRHPLMLPYSTQLQPWK